MWGGLTFLYTTPKISTLIKKIDKYIILKYLKTFFFTVLIFSMIAFIIDLSTQMENFLEEACTLEEIVTDYYLPFIPWINGLLFPLYALISVIFFTSRMAYDSEIISILNAGVSFRRLMFPYILASLFIGSLHFLANHYVIPLGNKSKVDFEHKYLYKGENRGRTRDVHLVLSRDTTNQTLTKAYVSMYDNRDTSVRQLVLERFKDNKLKYRLKAGRANWIKPPNHWQLKDYEIRTFNEDAEEMIFGKRKTIDTTLNMFHDDFVLYENDKLTMTTPELRKAIKRERQRGVKTTKSFLIEIQRRTAEPFTIIIVTLIGMAIASRKVRGGLGLHLALGVGLGATYVFLSRFSTTFATNQTLEPGIAVWIPNILFTVILIFLISKAQK